MTSPNGVAYLVSRYPHVSHTFIEREVAALRARGLRVDTFTVRPCPSDQLLSDAMRADAATTTPLIGSPRREWTRALGDLVRHHPHAALAGAKAAARAGERTARSKLWQQFYLAEAALLHAQMRHRGLRHVHAHFANVASDVARLTAVIGNAVDGGERDEPGMRWRWSFSMHGPTEFEAVRAFDLAAKVEQADGVACITDFCRSQLMRLVDPEHWGKLDIVRMSVDAGRYAPPGAREHRDDPRLRLLYVGRLVPEKGSLVLLDALADLTRQGVPVQARFVGAGPLEDTLRTVIARKGLEAIVDLVGAVGQDELPEHYHWADAFVLPSFQEGLPVVIMEALATELPVITTRIAGIPELVVDHEMGRVVTPGRADALAGAIRDVAGDPERRARQGEAGRAAVIRFHDPSTTSAAMADFLATVQNRPRAI